MATSSVRLPLAPASDATRARLAELLAAYASPARAGSSDPSPVRGDARGAA